MEEKKRQAVNAIADQLKVLSESQPTEREQYMIRAVSDIIWGHADMYVPFPDSEANPLFTKDSTL